MPRVLVLLLLLCLSCNEAFGTLPPYISETAGGYDVIFSSSTYSGWGSASAFDVNGDGYGDFIQANGLNHNLLFLGSANPPATVDIDTSSNVVVFYSSINFLGDNGVHGIGDFDKDGYDDLILAEHTHIFLLFGDPTWTGTVNLDNLSPAQIVDFQNGVVAAPAGDFDNYGYKDFVVGDKSYHRQEWYT